MQAVETTGGEEARHRIGPALYQDAAETARGERGNDGGGGELAVVRSNRHDFDTGGELSGRAGGGGHEPAHPPGPPPPRGRPPPPLPDPPPTGPGAGPAAPPRAGRGGRRCRAA